MNNEQTNNVMTSSGVIDIQGFNLGYSIEGKGIPALVIGSATYYPRTFLNEIREHLQLIFIDHRGFVRPPSAELTTDDYEIGVLLEDIDAMRAALNVTRCVVIGHSGHAFLALEYAKAYPQHVSQVVMIGASPDYSEATTQARQAFFDQHATPARKSALEKSMALLPARIMAQPDRRFIHMCVCAGPLSWYDYTFDATTLWEGVYTNMQILDYVWGVVFRDIDITKGLDTFDKPVFLALGKYDYLTGLPFLWNDVRPQFQNLTVHVFSKSAHTPQFEEPDRFNKSLLKWLYK
ncbi:alpha/beta fold hydrolase [Spirosoma knui]